ncbi:MAG: TIGR01777 family oxidoreductase [Acidimicrobiales bacterium]
MRVLVSGSTASSARRSSALPAAGHEPVRPVRGAAPDDLLTLRDPAAIFPDGLSDIDAVVHLAGEGIAERRWTKAQKARILDSRVQGTTVLATAMATCAHPPSVLLSGSAIGYYGDRGGETLTEARGAGSGFLASVAQAWESATAPASAAGVRVAHLRTGIVLAAHGGALASQLPLFRLGLGGRIGDGRQWWSWVALEDTVAALVWLLDHAVDGPVYLSAPTPVTNADFTRTLGRVLRRPTALPTPKLGPRIRLGRELAEELLYTSARVVPAALESSGFVFAHPELQSALRATLTTG